MAYNGYQKANTGDPFMVNFLIDNSNSKTDELKRNWESEFTRFVHGKHKQDIEKNKRKYLGAGYSPNFGQAAFHAWMNDKKFAMRKEVEEMMVTKAKEDTIREKLDKLWDHC